MQSSLVSASRLEAFSDGVIAIIITVMVFDIKFTSPPDSVNIFSQLSVLLPKILSYLISFAMLSVMWVSHHQLFKVTAYVNNGVLWLNINLLFWMSLIPFAAGFVGASPSYWLSSAVYGAIFLLCALSFSALRLYIMKKGILKKNVNVEDQQKILSRNKYSVTLYIAGIIISPFLIPLSFLLYITVPVMYIRAQLSQALKAGKLFN